MKPESKAKMVASLKVANKDNAKPFTIKYFSYAIPEYGDRHLSTKERRKLARLGWGATCGSLSEGVEVLVKHGVMNTKDKPYGKFALSEMLAPERFQDGGPVRDECIGANRVIDGIRRWIVVSYVNEEGPGHYPGNEPKPVIEVSPEGVVAHKSLLAAAWVVYHSDSPGAEVLTVRASIKRAVGSGMAYRGRRYRQPTPEEARAILEGTFGKEVQQ